VQFVPFIQGPRNCLGQYFALLEARIVLSLLVKVTIRLTGPEALKVQLCSVLAVLMKAWDAKEVSESQRALWSLLGRSCHYIAARSVCDLTLPAAQES